MIVSHRRIWTLEEWKDFTSRCRSARDELHSVIEDFPDTNGITSKIIDGFLNAERDLFYAMVKLETFIANQHPDVDNQVMRIVHEPQTPVYTKLQNWGTRKSPNLTREQWQAIGDRVMAVREMIINLGLELRTARGESVKNQTRFIRIGELSALRCKLDGLLCKQHPDWREGTQVFYVARPVSAIQASHASGGPRP